jgi:hypothetical protein
VSDLPSYDVTDLVRFEEKPDGSMTVEPHDCGVAPCFMPCGQPACQTLGCVRVYNARHQREQDE